MKTESNKFFSVKISSTLQCFTYKNDENVLFAMQGWVLASDEVYEPSYVIRNLQPNTSYMFLVRAQNSHGLSFPSPVTAVIRTQG